MGRRRSDIKAAVRWALYEFPDHFVVCYVNRGERGSRIVCVPGERIVYTDSWAVYLDDDTAIPYHRIVEVRAGGRVLWSSRRGESDM